MPPRYVLPRPLQRPHPPLWVACSRRETIHLAARSGIGALSFSFVEPEDAARWVGEYYDLIASRQCQPRGFAVNANVAVVLPMMLHHDEATAIERGIDGAHFFGYSLRHYYGGGTHLVGDTDLWTRFCADRAEHGFARDIVHATAQPLAVRLLQAGLGSLRGAIGTPAQVTDLLARYEAAGVDQVMFVLQAGHNRHDHICESIELFAREVLPRFADGRQEKEAAKEERLAPAVGQALARRPGPRSLPAPYQIDEDAEFASRRRAPRARPDSVRQQGRAPGCARRPRRRLRRQAGADLRSSPARSGSIFTAMARQFNPAESAGFRRGDRFDLGMADGTRRPGPSKCRTGRPGHAGVPAPMPRSRSGSRWRTSSGRSAAEAAFTR